MSRNSMLTNPGRKARRQFTPEYKAQVVQVCRDSGKSPEAVARDLGLTPTAVRRWYDQSKVSMRAAVAKGR